jgi:hypothetical protein
MNLELPVIPRVGEVFLAINLSAVEKPTVAETLQILEKMGYNPQLRYRQARDGSISLYALLKQEQVDAEMLTHTDYLGDELDALAAVIQPADAITSPRGILPANKSLVALGDNEKKS